MFSDQSQFYFFLTTLVFMMASFMHLAKKSTSVVMLYIAQSLAIALLLLTSALREGSLLFFIVVIATFVVKVLIAPYFFFDLIKKNRLKFTASTYVNGPLTLIILAALTLLPFSKFFSSFALIAEGHEQALFLALASMFISIFLIINRRGALAQMVGILSLENSIVLFAAIAGLEASALPQFGILFDITVWILIATIFGSMVYRHFGSLNVDTMNSLKEK